MTAVDPKVIEKIRKLLALGGEQSGATEAERDLALQRAQEVMLRHDLALSDVEVKDPDRKVTREKFGVIDQADRWEGELLSLIASASFCGCLVGSWYGGARYSLVGRPEHVAYVRELHKALVPQLKFEVAQALKDMTREAQLARRYGLAALRREELLNGGGIVLGAETDVIAEAGVRRLEGLPPGDRLADIARLCDVSETTARNIRPFILRKRVAPTEVENLGVFRRSFLSSASATVRRRLLDARRAFTEGTGDDSGRALVVQEEKAVEDWMKENNIKTGRASIRQWDADGWAAGAKAGGRVSVSTGGKSLPGTRPQIGGGSRG